MTAPSIRWIGSLHVSVTHAACFLTGIAGKARFLFIVWLLFVGVGSARAVDYVDVIVDNALYSSGEVTTSLNQYLSDITEQGYTPRLVTSSFADPAALRTYLANEYSTYSIKGAVMIGDMPVEHFERNGQFGDPNAYQRFACDLYYMDVNGSWSDATANGTYDTHTGNVAPEIWVSHIAPSNVLPLNAGQTETSLLNNYFAKAHQYRIGQMRLPQSGLAYIDDDWSGSGWQYNLAASVAGRVDTFQDSTATVATDYVARVAAATSPKYESLLLACHSGPNAHVFKNNGDWGGGDVYNSDLSTLDTQAFFYNLFACSNGDFEYSGGCMGLQYVFGTQLGLLSVSTTKTGSMLNFGEYYNPLGTGSNFGQAYLAWWNAMAAGGFDDGEKDWYYGMTLTGDPFLKTQAYTTAAYATWNGGTSSWTYQGTNWTAGGAAFNWDNRGTGATFSGPAPGSAIPISGIVYTHGMTINADGYSFSGSSSDLLELLGGGIAANGNTTVNCPILVCDNQSWTVASGKTLTVGAVHTLYSTLAINGSGTTTITGPIDSGAVLGIVGGVAAGGITKSGTGTLKLTGAGTSAVNILASAGTVNFAPAAGVTSVFSGVISGSGAINKTDNGAAVFTGTNTYTSNTTISAGALQADNSAGLPNTSFLILDGGVIQSNGTTTFFRTLSSSGSGKFRFTTSGGGFAAGEGPMIVKINNGTSTINWGTASTNINGTLKFGSLTAANVVTLQNGLSLAGSTRTIEVIDNPSSAADWAEITGVISYGSGTAGIKKSGDGLLILSGTNSYNGTTTISGGALQVAEGVGMPAGRMIVLDGGVLQLAGATTFSRSLGTSGATFEWTANGGGFAAGGSGDLTVNVGGGGVALNWGTGVGSGIMGTLKFGSPTAGYGVTFQNPINLNGGARTIQVDGNTVTLTSLVSDSVGSGSLTKAGAGRLVLPIANTFSGNLTVSGGMLVGSVYNAFGPMSSSRAISVSGGGTLSLGASDMLGTYTSAIPNVSLNNGAVLNAAGTHQAFNSLTLASGTLSAAGDAGVPGSGGWGSWNLGGLVTSSGVSLIGGTDSGASVTLQSGDAANPSTTFDVADGALTVSLPLYDGIDGHATGGNYLLHSTGLVKTGSGTLTLNAVNSYSGATTINGGVISTDNLAPAGVNCGIGSGSSLVFDGGGLVYSGTASVTFDRAITLGAGGGILGSSGGNLTYTRPISGAGGFTFLGSGTTTLSGSSGNTYLGATTVSGGKLVLAKTSGYAIPGDFTLADAVVVAQNANQFPTTAAVTFTGAGGSTLEVYGRSVTVAGISGSGVIENTETETGVGNGGLVVNSSTNGTFSGTLRNSLSGSGTFSLTKSGEGVLTLVGANTGQYTGVLTVNAGTLDYSGGSLPSGNYAINGGLLNIGSQSKSISQLLMTGGTLSGSGALTSVYTYNVQGGVINAALGGLASLNKSGTGSATVNSPTYTGNTIVQAGRLTFTGGLPTGNYLVTGGTLDIGGLSKSIRTFQVNGGTVTGSGTLTVTTGTYTLQAGQVDVTLGGANTVSKSTAGTAVFTAANTYTGQTNLTAGTLQVRNVSALGTTAGKTVVSSGAVLSAGGGLTGTINEPLDLNGVGDGNGALQAVDAGTNVTFAGPVSLVSNAGIGGASPLRVSGAISGAAELTKYGTNRVTLTGANTYTGRTTVAGGTLELATAAQSVVLSSGGADVQSGRLVFAYAGGSDPASTIAGLLTASYHGGLWDTGQFRNTTASSTGLTLGWLDDTTSHAVTVMATYAGDFNMDGVADATDMTTLVSHLGQSGNWSAGDANYDGLVDLLDWNLWKSNVGRPALSLPTAAIPEPSTLALAFAGLLGLAGYAWRRSRSR